MTSSDSRLDAKALGVRRTNRGAPYERLKAAILDGEIPPGSPLVEARVAEWCGVSRTPVREAFTRLEQDGLVERTDRGLVVKERSPEEILDIYEVRIVLEAMIARCAAERRTQLDVRRIESLAAASHDVPADELVEYNRRFHRAIWAASHNDALIGLLDRLNSHLLRYPATTLTYPGRWETAVRQHDELVEAIREQDGERAAAVAGEHFTSARDVRLKLYEERVI